eukprot:TRINITY_DN17399_c0_g1_i7.p1 TRINITY_DN17399_c0_g1~~TRINITY_DN17399_c0_g1_i7.p1  ORF type:complete len:759 (-),score=135.31 TRINITY_DN17399_c0_g1_i7:99-2327(-)
MCRSRGFNLPLLGHVQHDSPDLIGVLLCCLCIVYLCSGVSVLTCTLHAAVEKITGTVARKRAREHQQFRTVKVWNGTVASLTLVANDETIGELGPSIILGASAFKLLVVLAAWIATVPSPRLEVLQTAPIVYIAGLILLLACAWLLVTVHIHSPDVVDVWECTLTMFMFPILVSACYVCDRTCVVGNSEGLPANKRGGQAARALQAGVLPGADEPSPFVNNVQMSTSSHVAGEEAPSAGILTFFKDCEELECGLKRLDAAVMVLRRGGRCGKVSCRYMTRGLSAVPGYDFQEASGELCFADGQGEAFIQLSVLPRRLGQRCTAFQVVLEQATGGATFNPDMDGEGTQLVLTILITAASEVREARSSLDRCRETIDWLISLNGLKRGAASWFIQMRHSFLCSTGESSGQEQRCKSTASVLCAPWKCLYSVLVPPPEFFGGWLCLFAALLQIGVLAALLLDLAQLLGCMTGIRDTIVAMTLLALGTSTRDVVELKLMATDDFIADGPVLNLVGSSAVSVLLGLSLPWTLGSARAARGEKELVVFGGSLSCHLASFCGVAVMALCTLRARKVLCGGELGGSFVAKWTSSILLTSLWIFYVFINIWSTEHADAPLALQVSTAFIALACMGCVCGLAVPSLQLLERHFFQEARPSSAEVAAIDGTRQPRASAQAEAAGEAPGESSLDSLQRQLEQLQQLEEHQRPTKRSLQVHHSWVWLPGLPWFVKLPWRSVKLPCLRSSSEESSV